MQTLIGPAKIIADFSTTAMHLTPFQKYRYDIRNWGAPSNVWYFQSAQWEGLQSSSGNPLAALKKLSLAPEFSVEFTKAVTGCK